MSFRWAVDQLPVAPTAFRQLTALLEQSEPSPREIAAVVARDPVLSAKLLQLVNTSFFSRGVPITELLPAVTRLGLRLVRYVALEVGAFRDAKARKLAIDVDALQARCVIASGIARALVSSRADQEPAGAAALLAELGTLVFAMFRASEWLALARAPESGPWAERERAAFGCGHAEISAYLLALWGLPEVVARAVLSHHKPLPPPSETIDVATAVALAHAIVDQQGSLPEPWAEAPQLRAHDGVLAALLEQARSASDFRRGAV